jgi:hypothetical protein
VNKARPALLGGRQRGFQSEAVVLLKDNVRPHSAQVNQQTIVEIGWEILPQPTNSLDLIPCDFHLFEPTKETLRWKRPADNDKA